MLKIVSCMILLLLLLSQHFFVTCWMLFSVGMTNLQILQLAVLQCNVLISWIQYDQWKYPLSIMLQCNNMNGNIIIRCQPCLHRPLKIQVVLVRRYCDKVINTRFPLNSMRNSQLINAGASGFWRYPCNFISKIDHSSWSHRSLGLSELSWRTWRTSRCKLKLPRKQ